jgi:hypothetical protein
MGELEERTRGRVPASRLLQGGGGVQGGSRLASVGDEELALFGEEGLVLGVDGAELAVAAPGGGDVSDQPGTDVLQWFASDQSLSQSGCLFFREALVVHPQRGVLGRPGGE